MLFGSEMLEVAIGLSFMFLLLSIVCSTVTEWIAWALGLRAKALEQGIGQLVLGSVTNTAGKSGSGTTVAATTASTSQPALGPAAASTSGATPATSVSSTQATASTTNPSIADAQFLAKILDHPLIEAIKKDGAMPSYIHARTFAGALLATVSGGHTTLENLRAALAPPADGATAAIPDHLRRQLVAILADTGDDLDAFRTGVETWFDDAMERVGGWYKRYAQRWTILIAVVVTLLINANTFAIASGLLNDPTSRAVFVAEAGPALASPGTTGAPQLKLSDVQADLEPIAFGLGWAGFDPSRLGAGAIDPGQAAAHVLGWLITIVALSMGAPFWFDAVGRLVNLRAAGKRPTRAT
jgi:hypothetical protein